MKVNEVLKEIERLDENTKVVVKVDDENGAICTLEASEGQVCMTVYKTEEDPDIQTVKDIKSNLGEDGEYEIAVLIMEDSEEMELEDDEEPYDYVEAEMSLEVGKDENGEALLIIKVEQ